MIFFGSNCVQSRLREAFRFLVWKAPAQGGEDVEDEDEEDEEEDGGGVEESSGDEQRTERQRSISDPADRRRHAIRRESSNR